MPKMHGYGDLFSLRMTETVGGPAKSIKLPGLSGQPCPDHSTFILSTSIRKSKRGR